MTDTFDKFYTKNKYLMDTRAARQDTLPNYYYLKIIQFLPKDFWKVQGGCDISGTLSKLHCHIKK
jgi:hypothetical protein